jgi:hypothetical protein
MLDAIIVLDVVVIIFELNCNTDTKWQVVDCATTAFSKRIMNHLGGRSCITFLFLLCIVVYSKTKEGVMSVCPQVLCTF